MLFVGIDIGGATHVSLTVVNIILMILSSIEHASCHCSRVRLGCCSNVVIPWIKREFLEKFLKLNSSNLSCGIGFRILIMEFVFI